MFKTFERFFEALFLDAFRKQYLDHTKQQWAGIKIETLNLHFPLIDEYVAEFEDLATLAGYTIGSIEMINLFLKGLTTSSDVFEKVMDHLMLNNYYDLRDKAISIIKARQLVNALKQNTTTPGRFNQLPAFRQGYWPLAPSRPPPCIPQYNSMNAPRWMNNIPVLMDLSREQAPFN